MRVISLETLDTRLALGRRQVSRICHGRILPQATRDCGGSEDIVGELRENEHPMPFGFQHRQPLGKILQLRRPARLGAEVAYLFQLRDQLKHVGYRDRLSFAAQFDLTLLLRPPVRPSLLGGEIEYYW
ncbi:MAG: hypothetical protein M1325_00325 [Actinobacteria bacterium]|nr:hypothetical protein [Actinomycetota bacterium]